MDKINLDFSKQEYSIVFWRGEYKQHKLFKGTRWELNCILIELMYNKYNVDIQVL